MRTLFKIIFFIGTPYQMFLFWKNNDKDITHLLWKDPLLEEMSDEWNLE